MTLDTARPHSALVLVDIQPDFLPGGALACANADQIVAPIAQFVDHADFGHYVATQDWHPAGHVSFASSHAGAKPFDTIALYDHPQVMWPDHCVQNTPGAALCPGIAWEKMNVIVRKGSDPRVDSYSAFRENFNPAGTRPSTGLAGWLKDRKVDEVYICGLARDVCVLWTAQDALALGFRPHVIWDLTAPVNHSSNEKTRQILHEQGIAIVQSAQLLNWSR